MTDYPYWDHPFDSNAHLWKPGDPCGTCGSTNTAWGDVGEGAVCYGCGRMDSDE